MHERTVQLAELRTCLVDGPWPAKLRVVFLHGYDMRASDLTPFAHSMAIPGVAYAFPQAPTAVSDTGFAWWPLVRPKAANQPGAGRDLWQEYPAGRKEARALLGNLLRSLAAECHEPLMLAGFSQGGMLACDSILLGGADVSSLAMMSSSCIALEEWSASRDRLKGLAAFVSHGRADSDLSFEAGERLARFLASSGAAVTWAPFDGGHEIPFYVWKQFKRFLQSKLHDANEALPHAHETHGCHPNQHS